MTIKQFFDIVELRTKIVSVSTFILAAAYSAYTGADIFTLNVLILFFAALAVDMGTTGFNTLFDFLRGTDDKELNREDEKVLVHHGVDPTHALIVSSFCYAAAVVLGVVLGLRTDWRIIPVGALCMAVGYFYTGGPYPISRTPLGEIFAGGFLGSVFFLICVFVMTGQVTWEAFLISLPSTILIASILTANNTCDIEGDTKSGRKTLSILLGRSRASGAVYVLGVSAFLLLVFYYYYGIIPATIRFPLGAAIIGVFFVYKRMNKRGYSHETKSRTMGDISLVFMIYTAAVAAGYIWYMIIN